MHTQHYIIYAIVAGDDWEGLSDLIYKMVKEHPPVLLAARNTHTINGIFTQCPTKEHGKVWPLGQLSVCIPL